MDGEPGDEANMNVRTNFYSHRKNLESKFNVGGAYVCKYAHIRIIYVFAPESVEKLGSGG